MQAWQIELSRIARGHKRHLWHCQQGQECWCGLCHCPKFAALLARIAAIDPGQVKPQ